MFPSSHVLTSLSCFFDMKTITEMVENDESHDKIKERLLIGKDWKSEIEKFVIMDPWHIIQRIKKVYIFKLFNILDSETFHFWGQNHLF